MSKKLPVDRLEWVKSTNVTEAAIRVIDQDIWLKPYINTNTELPKK